MEERTKKASIGSVQIGGGLPVLVQSMCNIPLSETDSVINQIGQLHDRGARLVRFSVRNMNEAGYIRKVVNSSEIPVCADIHFDYKLAIAAIEAGVAKIRLNPGNIKSEDGVRRVVEAAKSNGTAIRIGVNGGSVNRTGFSGSEERILVDHAFEHLRILENNSFYNTVISIKSSDVLSTLKANRLLAKECDYPIHIGLTEAGYGNNALIKSSVTIGALLLDGIGDTVRVSMTGDPLQEIDAAYEILKAVNRLDYGINIISCPTCGRTDRLIDLEALARDIDKAVNARYLKVIRDQKKIINIAVMGCEVNGPGEASEADIGVAGCGRGQLALFLRGKIIKKVNQDRVVDQILEYAGKIVAGIGLPAE
ncbi:MAG: flavodoxin-dependent (E)-4-hydroxy-3-methylbut-2-enyl-diphosphate synthase [Spirochaetes bacterium]|nr:flavodoxin-dependent (E)-4-hydroxy-3-methylbut-2-enyl-diphosphate synthase [Spirochaetota bacterium]MBN2771489.1 flavodoxin-dependent (E)-4-hydroxy-3-methylbut-2-enyl-diphosphate synthase [Spirochaetota bacterium]